MERKANESTLEQHVHSVHEGAVDPEQDATSRASSRQSNLQDAGTSRASSRQSNLQDAAASRASSRQSSGRVSARSRQRYLRTDAIMIIEKYFLWLFDIDQLVFPRPFDFQMDRFIIDNCNTENVFVFLLSKKLGKYMATKSLTLFLIPMQQAKQRTRKSFCRY